MERKNSALQRLFLGELNRKTLWESSKILIVFRSKWAALTALQLQQWQAIERLPSDNIQTRQPSTFTALDALHFSGKTRHRFPRSLAWSFDPGQNATKILSNCWKDPHRSWMIQDFYKMDYSEKERLVSQSQVDNNICHKVISIGPFRALILSTEQTGFVEWCSTGQQEHAGFRYPWDCARTACCSNNNLLSDLCRINHTFITKSVNSAVDSKWRLSCWHAVNLSFK